MIWVAEKLDINQPPAQAVTFLNKGLDYFIPIFNASVGNPPLECFIISCLHRWKIFLPLSGQKIPGPLECSPGYSKRGNDRAEEINSVKLYPALKTWPIKRQLT
jgi:hypothetical protein